MTKILGYVESYRMKELSNTVCGRADVSALVLFRRAVCCMVAIITVLFFRYTGMDDRYSIMCTRLPCDKCFQLIF